MSDSVRDWLANYLTPLLPAEWRILRTQRPVPVIDRITVQIKHTAMNRLPEAPRGSLSNEVVLTIADYHTDQDLAENELDDAVLELVTALDASNKLTWTDAKKVLVNDAYVGWDITIQLISRKE